MNDERPKHSRQHTDHNEQEGEVRLPYAAEELLPGGES